MKNDANDHMPEVAEWNVQDMDVPGYLRALGVTPQPPGLALLEQLHHAHVHTFPFSNVEVLLGSHPGVEAATVHEQLVQRRRGGYCFEHAQLFAAALETLGFSVRRALGRVRSLQSARTHMTVLVDLHGVRYLCDPGFGFSVTGPVQLAEGAARWERGRQFTIGRVMDQGWPLWSLNRDGGMEHVLDESTVHPSDVLMGHMKTSMDPGSVFRNGLMVMKHTPEAHVTLTQNGRSVRTPGAPTRHETLEPEAVVDHVTALGVSLTREESQRLVGIVQRLRR